MFLISSGMNPVYPPQDDLIDRLGGVDKVAELTGRSKRMVRGEDGKFRFLTRATNVPIDMVRSLHPVPVFVSVRSRALNPDP